MYTEEVLVSTTSSEEDFEKAALKSFSCVCVLFMLYMSFLCTDLLLDTHYSHYVRVFV